MDFKKLYRSRKHCLLCGVCGGIGEYAGVDPVLIRPDIFVPVSGRRGRPAFVPFGRIDHTEKTTGVKHESKQKDKSLSGGLCRNSPAAGGMR